MAVTKTDPTLRDKFVELFGMHERTDNYTDAPHARLWSGGYSPSISVDSEGFGRVRRILHKLGVEDSEIEEVEAWCDYPYRVVYRIAKYRAHVTYCEGDVSYLEAYSDSDFIAINFSADLYYEDR